MATVSERVTSGTITGDPESVVEELAGFAADVQGAVERLALRGITVTRSSLSLEVTSQDRKVLAVQLQGTV